MKADTTTEVSAAARLTSRGRLIELLLKLYNFFGFKAAWWVCVLGAAWGGAYWGPVSMAAFLALHIWLIGLSREELRFWIFAAVFGTITDSIYTAAGFITYQGGYPGIDWLAPFWITGMWVGFTATLHHSLVIMRDHAWLAFLLGAIFGPVSYLTAESVGAIAIHADLLTSSLVLGILWGLLMPFLYWVSARLGMPQQS